MAQRQVEESVRSFLPHLTTILLVLAATFAQPELRSSRPSSDRSSLDAVDRNQWMPARMWQDPLMPMEKARESWTLIPESLDNPVRNKESGTAQTEINSTQPSNTSSILASFKRLVPHRDVHNRSGHFQKAEARDLWGPDDLVVIVTLDGGGYPEDIESRRRTRYAVVMAALSRLYSPKDAEHLGVLLLESGQAQSNHDSGPAPVQMIIPYERFDAVPESTPASEINVKSASKNSDRPSETKSKKKPARVFVLWVNRDHIAPDPPVTGPQKLRQLISAIKATKPTPISMGEPRVCIIGPRTSADLKEWNDEGLFDKPARVQNTLPDSGQYAAEPDDFTARVISPWATAEIPNLAPSALWNTIPPDSLMLQKLCEELVHRQVKLNEKNKWLVLAEADTYYGRQIKVGVRNAAKPGNSSWVIDFDYLRGLDGFIPGMVGSASQKVPEVNQDSTQKIRKPDGSVIQLQTDRVPKAFGPQQLDYLSRLAQKQLIRSEESNYRISAVFVLGSDVYDKLLLLRAFRQQFPGAVYVTTDLDARLVDPAESDATRNLIVASSHGYEPEKDIPEVRDSYQSSVYHAACAAIDNVEPRGVRDVKLFEIGRHQAVDISLESTDTSDVGWIDFTLIKPPLLVLVLGVGVLVYLSTRNTMYRQVLFNGSRTQQEHLILQSFAWLVSMIFLCWILVTAVVAPIPWFKQTWPSLTTFFILVFLFYILSPSFRRMVRRAFIQMYFSFGPPIAILSGYKRKRVSAACPLLFIVCVSLAVHYAVLFLTNDSRYTAVFYSEVILLIVILVAIRFWTWYRQCLVGPDASERGRILIWTMLLWVFVLVEVDYIAFQSTRSGGEPFSLDEGVSVWPYCILTLLAAIVALSFFVVIHRLQLGRWAELCAKFQINPGTKVSGSFYRWAAWGRKDLKLTRPWRRKRDGESRWWKETKRFFEGWLDSSRRSQSDVTLKDKKKHVDGEPIEMPVQEASGASLQASHSVDKKVGECSKSHRAKQTRRRLWQVVNSVFWAYRPLPELFLNSNGNIKMRKLCDRYAWLNHPLNRLIRIGSITLVFLLMYSFLQLLIPKPHAPIRGEESQFFVRVVGGMASISLAVLAFSVVDAIQVSAWFGEILSRARTGWSRQTLDGYSRQLGVGYLYVGEWLDVKFMAGLSEELGRFIKYPAIVLVLIVAGRSQYFDRWTWWDGYTFILGAYALMLMYATGMAQRCATKVRDRSLFRIKEYSRGHNRVKSRTGEFKVTHTEDSSGPPQNEPGPRTGSTEQDELAQASHRAFSILRTGGVEEYTRPVDEENAKQYERAVSDIQDIRQGAYTWVLRGPLMGAILILIGGYSLITLIEYAVT